MSAPASALERAIEISEALVRSAQRADWADVERLTAERHRLVRLALSPQNPDYPHAIPMRALLRMTALDSEIMSLANGERAERRARLAAARSGRKASNAYSSGAALP